MKKILLLCIVLCCSANSYADGTTIIGTKSVAGSSIETYTVNWVSWDNTYQNYANVSWSVTGGTVLNSDKHSVTIEWNPITTLYADGSGIIEVNEDLGGQGASLSIVVENNNVSISEFCSGILGPAKVSENFGSGTNPGGPIASGSTSYQYTSNCSLNVGEYTITNSSNLCRANWHNITADHTGNSNGYFLMLNASSDKNEIFRTTVTSLTTSFRYQFSAWVGNLYSSSGAQDPNIRFEIYDLSGTLIATSGSITVPVTAPTFQWQQIGFMFNLPPGVTTVDVVVLNARTSTNDVGNDIVIDDISFAPCWPGIFASFSNSTIVDREHVCSNGSVTLYSSWPATIPFSNPSYQWQRSTDNGASWSNITGATTLTYPQTESVGGIYTYRMLAYETSNPFSNVTSNLITYYVQSLVVNAKIHDLFACNGAPITGQLIPTYDFLYSDPADVQSYTYSWSPSTYLNNPNTLSPYISIPAIPPPSGSGPAPAPTNYIYTLTITNNNYGCTASATQTVSVYNPRKVGVPNAFTPNGDGINDIFYPINLEDYSGSEFIIWNRWGSEVFHSYGPTKASYGWNGITGSTPQPQGVYVWAVIFRGCPAWIIGSKGEGYNTGDVTLFR